LEDWPFMTNPEVHGSTPAPSGVHNDVKLRNR
jgi:hypothetical protein